MEEIQQTEPNLLQAREWIENAIRRGRVAHAYMLRVSTIKDGVAFAEHMLQRLFDPQGTEPTVAARIREHAHPDIIWLEPESKSRIIRMEQMRALIKQISQTSYCGGWKAGVISDAERMNDESANAFLKTLEEPPAKSLLLLLSHSPETLPATIRSRCQTLNLSTGTPMPQGPWREDLLAYLRRGKPKDMLGVMEFSAGLLKLLGTEQERVKEQIPGPDKEEGKSVTEAYEARVAARVLQVRHSILQCVQQWHRDVLFCVLGADDKELHFPGEQEVLRRQAAELDFGRATRILEEVDHINRRLERISQADEMVLSAGVARQAAIALGAE